MGLFSALLWLAGTIFVVSACSGSDSSVSDLPTWSYSGIVLDGSTDSVLAGAVVDYLDVSGNRQAVQTNEKGEFFVGTLPYGQRTFHFSCKKTDSAGRVVEFGERLIAASSYNESSSMPGALAGGSRVLRLFPLSGSVKGNIVVKVAGTGSIVPARGVTLEVVYRDTSFVNSHAASFLSKTDSVGAFQFTNLPADSGLQLSIPRFFQDGHWYNAGGTFFPRLVPRTAISLARTVIDADTASDYVEPILASNVLDASGLGLSGVGVTSVPWFRIAFPFDASHLAVQLLNGTTDVPVSVSVRGDTLFLNHADRLPANAFLTADISGLDGKGARFHAVLDGNRRFKTRPALTALESNTWSTSSAYRGQASLLDTLWVRFSEPLSSDLSQVQWSKSTQARTIYGRGPSVNAQAWVKAETLFVVPDQRLRLDTTGRMAFNVVAQAASGSQSAAVEIATDIASTAFSVLWTNSVNALGYPRDDLGSTDSIVLVANQHIASLLGFSAADAATLPTGIQAGDVRIHGDTIVYKPSTTLAPGTVWGLGFDVQTTKGVVFRKALQVRWKTVYKLSILSVNNRDGAEYRRFHALGDSLVVRFSQPIDTGKGFLVHMKDARGNQVQTKTVWNSSLDQASVFNTTPYPLANFGITTTTNSSGDTARAVSNVTFDLQSKAGEKIYGLQPTYDTLRIYTEAGLAAVGSNILKSHSSGYEVMSTETVVDSFPIGGAVEVSFNRILDTAWIRRTGDSTFVNLQSSSGPVVATKISFLDGGATIVLAPISPLTPGTAYYVQFLKLPGLGIRDALAIGRSGGTFGGTTSTGFLVGSPFTAR